jgi:putative flavoprotein involved in K+ transport
VIHTEHVAVAIIGGGPSGLGISYLLTAADRPHVVLEQARIGANWTLQLPGCPYDGDDPLGFMPKDEVVAFIEAYADGFSPPVREGVRATAVAVGPDGRGFHIRTADTITFRLRGGLCQDFGDGISHVVVAPRLAGIA